MRVERRPGVGPAGDPHAAPERAPEPLAGELDERGRLLDRVRRYLVGVVDDPADRRDRRDVERPALLHQPGALRRQHRSVFDRVHAGADRPDDPLGPDRVRADHAAPRMRLVDRGVELLLGERREVVGDPRGEHAAGRDELDRRSAGSDLLAHRAPEPLRPVDLAREPDLVPVPARDRQRPAGRQDPRTGEQAAFDAARDLDHRIAAPSQVPHRGHAVIERVGPRCARPSRSRRRRSSSRAPRRRSRRSRRSTDGRGSRSIPASGSCRVRRSGPPLAPNASRGRARPTHATRPSATSTPARSLTVRPSNSVTFET